MTTLIDLFNQAKAGSPTSTKAEATVNRLNTPGSPAKGIVFRHETAPVVTEFEVDDEFGEDA